MKGPWLVAAQPLTLLFADIEGSAAMAQRRGDAWAT
jgi:class 3 adenylate cyclase